VKWEAVGGFGFSLNCLTYISTGPLWLLCQETQVDKGQIRGSILSKMKDKHGEPAAGLGRSPEQNRGVKGFGQAAERMHCYINQGGVM
jgi:hypothetical protein